ncbi:MAG: UDP-N-acetylglucosamine 2-epimerase (non-hydrolyzing) [Firmicutes bacterium]|nr:UDP-N-acetylglucosamine 2-epimerase (non-hydrolyzing) [Bacillota bacterium]
MKILSVFGTRPEAIKMAPLVSLLAHTIDIESKICVTAQHREMLDTVLDLFCIKPDYDLNIMRHGQSLCQLTAAVLTALDAVLNAEKPDLLLVHGDTTTTFAGSLAAFYHRLPCGHVEAGLRTAHKYAPYPEEVNRRLTGTLAEWHFAPTSGAADNLLAEGVAAKNIFITGNTVIDALLATVHKPCDLEGLGLEKVDWSRRVLLLTCHRRENWGRPMKEIFSSIAALLVDFSDIEVIYPVHRNPGILAQARECLSGLPRLHMCEPLPYLPFCHVMKRCYLVLTDSGGLQEEAPALGKPVLVLREVTERPEAIAAGTARLAGIGRDTVYAAVSALLQNEAEYKKMARSINPYGDGHAAERIRDIISGLNI